MRKRLVVAAVVLSIALWVVRRPPPVPEQLGLFDGPYIEFHPDGQLARVGTYVHGIRQGAWAGFDERGVLTDMTRYVDGHLIGLVLETGADGVARFTHHVEGRGAPTPAQRRQLADLAAWLQEQRIVDCGVFFDGDPAALACVRRALRGADGYVARLVHDEQCGDSHPTEALVVGDATGAVRVDYERAWDLCHPSCCPGVGTEARSIAIRRVAGVDAVTVRPDPRMLGSDHAEELAHALCGPGSPGVGAGL